MAFEANLNTEACDQQQEQINVLEMFWPIIMSTCLREVACLKTQQDEVAQHWETTAPLNTEKVQTEAKIFNNLPIWAFQEPGNCFPVTRSSTDFFPRPKFLSVCRANRLCCFQEWPYVAIAIP